MMNTRITRRCGIPTARTSLLVAGVLALAGLGISNAAANEAPPSAPGATLQTMAHYVRDSDHRDGASLSKLFTTDGKVDISAKNAKGNYEAVASPIVGRDAIEYAVTHFQAPLRAPRDQ